MPCTITRRCNIGIKKNLAMMATITNQNLSQKDILIDIFNRNWKILHPYDKSFRNEKYENIFKW